MKRFLGIATILVLLCSIPSFAQTSFTSLRGVVKDPTGALVTNATITITNRGTSRTNRAEVNSAGEYQFSKINPATYTITASAAGFAPQSKTAQLIVDTPATVDFTLTVQASSVTVDVSASAQTLNTSDASLGGTMNSSTIQALPSETRNVPDLLSLQPGVIYIPTVGDSRTGAVNGGRADQGNITVDGIDDNDQVGGFAFTGILRQTMDSIDEFRVTTGAGGADSGRSSGAQVSMVTKSGTNHIHGSVYEYMRNGLVANDWFAKQQQIINNSPNVPAKLIRNIFGGTIGGPILRNKLFLFYNYEGTRQRESTTVYDTVPTQSFLDGNIKYLSTTDGAYHTLSTSDIVSMDAACAVCGSAAYPNGPGPNPNVNALLKQLPVAQPINVPGYGDNENSGVYAFVSPLPKDYNTHIARFDWNPSEKHRIFVRGNLQKDRYDSAEILPGVSPGNTVADARGLTAAWTWTISNNLVSDLHYGFVREAAGVDGVVHGDTQFTNISYFTSPLPQTRSSVDNTPVNNLIENLTWTKGKHTLSFGANWRLIHRNYKTDTASLGGANNYPQDYTTPAPEPADLDLGTQTSYDSLWETMVGAINSANASGTYDISGINGGTLLPAGDWVSRSFRANEFEWYVQDSWRVTPKLTVTLGVRHSLLQTPYEVNGREMSATVDTHAWYLEREAAAQRGTWDQPDLSFGPAGKYWNKAPYYPMEKRDFAPRLSIAYAPNDKTSIRAGAGIYYDHFGEGLINSVAQGGQFGLSVSQSTQFGQYTPESAPRYIDANTIPVPFPAVPDSVSFPYTPPPFHSNGGYGIDTRMKTPYSETFTFSVQRQLPLGFSVEAAYYGRLGRHLLQSLDLAEPTDYKDPNGGGDYFAAAANLDHQTDMHGGDGSASVNAIPYFENVFPWMANFDYAGESATQAIYYNEWAYMRDTWGETTVLQDLERTCQPEWGGLWEYNEYNDYNGKAVPCPDKGGNSLFYSNQFTTLFTLSSLGNSYYNSGQITLHHPMSHGIQFDLSYTHARSIDYGSETEFNNTAGSNWFSVIYNTWHPEYNRSLSDFDVSHSMTLNYIWQLPVGRGKMLAGSSNRLLDAVIGGWQLAGIFRANSGLPFTIYTPAYNTNWSIQSSAVQIGKVKMRRHKVQGAMQFFDDPETINFGYKDLSGPLRLAYGGESGERNKYRGDGYFDLTSGLSKDWKTEHFGNWKLGWEVYNTLNSVRFDPKSIGATLGSPANTFGYANGTLTQSRRMQFSLRASF